jgi:uncharacterized membrane protein YheB (UPF0754 family)
MVRVQTTILLDAEQLDWIKEHRIILSEFVRHKIFDDMKKEKDKLRNPEDKLEDIQQQKFQLELREKHLIEQQQAKSSELQAIEEQEKAKTHERNAHQFLAETVYNNIAKGATLVEIGNMIIEFINNYPHLRAYITTELTPDLEAWYNRQLKIIEAAKQ